MSLQLKGRKLYARAVEGLMNDAIVIYGSRPIEQTPLMITNSHWIIVDLLFGWVRVSWKREVPNGEE